MLLLVEVVEVVEDGTALLLLVWLVVLTIDELVLLVQEFG